MRKQAYMSSEGIARDGCYQGSLKVCRQEESGGHILGCLHRCLDMKKQYIARYDKAMRVVVQAFTKVGLVVLTRLQMLAALEGLKELGVNSRRVPTFVEAVSYRSTA